MVGTMPAPAAVAATCGAAKQAVKNVVVIGASYAGEPLKASSTYIQCSRVLMRNCALRLLLCDVGSHAAEVLAASLPKNHRVILIDKNR